MSMNLESHRWWVMALTVLLGAEAATAIAEEAPSTPTSRTEPDRSKEAIAAAIKDLASPDPKTRDAATARLRAIGKPARGALEQAVSKSDDPEVQSRATALLARIVLPLEMNLSAPTTTIKPNQALPPITIDLRNASDQPVTVMTPVDGCDIGWRVVSYNWSLTDATGRDVPRKGLGRCGNTNPLTPNDFTQLAPGKSVRIEPGRTFLAGPDTYFAPLPAGTYKLSLRYAFDPTRAERGIGAEVGKEKLADLLKVTIQTEIVSNVLTIEVKD